MQDWCNKVCEPQIRQWSTSHCRERRPICCRTSRAEPDRCTMQGRRSQRLVQWIFFFLFTAVSPHPSYLEAWIFVLHGAGGTGRPKPRALGHNHSTQNSCRTVHQITRDPTTIGYYITIRSSLEVKLKCFKKRKEKTPKKYCATEPSRCLLSIENVV